MRAVRKKVSRNSVSPSRRIKRKKSAKLEPWLEEYEIEEREATDRAVAKILRLVSRLPDINTPFLATYVKTLYEDKFQFRETVSYNEFPQLLPTKLLLPFNDQVVLSIYPEKSRRDFVANHGLTPEEIARLYSNGRVLPILMEYPTRLSKEESSCLEVLLDEKPPTQVRVNKFLDYSSDMKLDGYVKHGSILAENAKAAIINQSRLKKMTPPKKAFQLADFLPTCYSQLCCLGLAELADKIVADYDILTANLLLYVYSAFLSVPMTFGAGAMPQICEDVAWPSRLPAAFGGLPKFEDEREMIFPVDIDEFLTRHYDLFFPVDPSMEMVDKMYRDKAVAEARKLLREFDKAVQEGKRKRAQEQGGNLGDAFLAASEALPAIDKKIEKCKWALAAVAYGGIGFSGLVSPAASLLAGVGYRVLEKKMTDVTTPVLARIRCNRLSFAIWKFEKELQSTQQLKDTLKRILSIRK